MFRSLNRRCPPLEQARRSFRANKLRSLAFGTPHCGAASLVCPHDRGAPEVIGSSPQSQNQEKNRSMKDLSFLGGISRTRTYDPHDVNVVL